LGPAAPADNQHLAGIIAFFAKQSKTYHGFACVFFVRLYQLCQEKRSNPNACATFDMIGRVLKNMHELSGLSAL
jgi:hypothetical protein